MKFTFIDPEGEDKSFSDVESLKVILNLDYKLWKGGPGDASIIVINNEQLILIKLEEGFFILFHPDYLSPEIDNNSPETIGHHIGGEEVRISKRLICNFDQAYEIIAHYILKKELHDEYNWEDSF